ncbi:hypothetical protein S7711_04353 [Stachybotrys chartarum IBT 7711]|uniref:Zn(2)-C6 fungal-type domain-containing protein n=1 Tax=Stachybotrys chartarum (strain CBS 109288 / IBT 7711) TaxID=1280523 RepID=A0A084AY65_STACB|nr:hypothetical protein S7711_04353 [Stachybotrys chartarum IBT 7711]KFA55829.1 hypothetical protein S40293_01984 [Stachybotrys chartarum IBT 40293]
MTRPKVPEEKRQRTAQACDICKRRKQKCNGKRPCASCFKKNLSCEYNANILSSHGMDEATLSPSKRRLLDDALDLSTVRVPGFQPANRPAASRLDSRTLSAPANSPTLGGGAPATNSANRSPLSQRHGSFQATGADFRTRQTPASDADEEAELVGQTRMLQDPKGRLLYVGDSATLAFLQLIRMLVEQKAGSSDFTLDPDRHKIMEESVKLPLIASGPYGMPSKEDAFVLVESYFTNVSSANLLRHLSLANADKTMGILELFGRQAFGRCLDRYYTSQSSMGKPELCLVYLTFAIGLAMATPAPNTPEYFVITRLRSGNVDRAEAFFRAARSLADPVSGFEDADLWSVQALALMSVYTLAVSRRNTAYAYHGMAVRTAMALGLHRIREFSKIFPEEHYNMRINIWRSIFVLDRFVSASLGRPIAISEEDCYEDHLEAPKNELGHHGADSALSAGSLDAVVNTCQTIGQILKQVYSRRKISTRLAQQIAEEYDRKTSDPRPDLDAKRLLEGTPKPPHCIAVLHIHLFRCHSTILLTRPFFLYLFTKEVREKGSVLGNLKRSASKLEKSGEACVAASIYTIRLVQAAHRSSYLPRRNPFVLYFLFAASLIVLSNEFLGLYTNDHYGSLVSQAIKIVEHCAGVDDQAKRLLYILQTFHATVDKAVSQDNGQPRLRMRMSDSSVNDPLSNLLPRHLRHNTGRQECRNRSNPSSICDSPACAATGHYWHINGQTQPVSSNDVNAGSVASNAASRTSSHSVADRLSDRATDGDTKSDVKDGVEHEVDFCFFDGQSGLFHISGKPEGDALQEPRGAAILPRPRIAPIIEGYRQAGVPIHGQSAPDSGDGLLLQPLLSIQDFQPLDFPGVTQMFKSKTTQ